MLTLWNVIDPLLNRLAKAIGERPRVEPSKPIPRPAAKRPLRPMLNKAPAIQAPTLFDQVPATPAPRAQSVVDAPASPPKPRRRARAVVVERAPAPIAAPSPSTRTGEADASMQERYDAVVQEMLDRYQIRVRKWRKNMSGVAWYVMYRDGRRVNLIESPKPKGPMSIAIFLHEIGHHAIGFDVYKPRCLEEFHAWRWSIEAMEACGLNITDSVRHRMHESLWYAVSKARRRGIKQLPVELLPFTERPPKRRRARGER